MTGCIGALQQQWKNSPRFRALTILAAITLVINVILTTAWHWGLMSVAETPQANDLLIYLQAGKAILAGSPLYSAPRPDFGVYVYSPAFAVLISPLTFLPYKLVLTFDILFHLAAYALIYWRWFTIFRRFQLDVCAETIIRLFPLWLVFTGLWYETAYLNIYIFMALIGTLLLEAVLQEQTGWSIFWLSILLPIKPQWAFAIGVPLLTGHWRFAFKVIAGGLAGYLGILLGCTALGGTYILEQYSAYFQFLQTIPTTFFWNTLAKDGYLGYNNSLLQLIIFLTNQAPYAEVLTYALKILILLPLPWLAWLHYQRKNTSAMINFKLELAFALYLVAFIWLDVVTELTLGIALFTYLLGSLEQHSAKNLTWIVFGPYAFAFFWLQITGILSFFITIPETLFDPARFIPEILIAISGLYGLLLVQLWQRSRWPNSKSSPIDQP